MYEELKNSVWNLEWLTDKYQEDVVSNLIEQAWAIDEMGAGVTVSEIEDVIWADFEEWAEKYLINEKEQIALNDE